MHARKWVILCGMVWGLGGENPNLLNIGEVENSQEAELCAYTKNI